MTLGRIQPTAAAAATKANGRQDEQDLQDGFCLRAAGVMDSLQLKSGKLFHPSHPVHRVEKSGINMMIDDQNRRKTCTIRINSSLPRGHEQAGPLGPYQ